MAQLLGPVAFKGSVLIRVRKAKSTPSPIAQRRQFTSNCYVLRGRHTPGRPLTIYNDNTACIHIGHCLLGSKVALHFFSAPSVPKKTNSRWSLRLQQGRHQGPGNRRFHKSIARTVVLYFPRHSASSFLERRIVCAGEAYSYFSHFIFFQFMALKHIFHFQRNRRGCASIIYRFNSGFVGLGVFELCGV
jgi:hypothetical protein